MSRIDGLAPLTLVVGDEELLVSRAVGAVVGTVRENDPAADVRDVSAAGLDSGTLLDLATPSLFGDTRLLVLRGAADLGDDVRDAVLRLVTAPPDGTYVVVVHPGGVKGRKVLDACKAANAHVVTCSRVDKVGDRLAFAQAEFAATGRRASTSACRVLVDAVGGELRELAAACAQLVADTTGTIDDAVVLTYFRGRAEATGFVVADRAVEGDVPGALTELRLARQAGVDPVLIVAALARQLRTVARVASAGRAAPQVLARELKLAPWMVDKARRQCRGWTPTTLVRAHASVAAADGEIKGGGSDPTYAVERVVLAVASARGRGR